MELKRREKNLTQEALGRDPDVRIGQWWISCLELGKGIPSPEQRLRLARRLGLDPDELLLPPVTTDATQEQEA
jgi:transcriptional regulator with XRE-family HTH domain